jgi:hypothetical protein
MGFAHATTSGGGSLPRKESQDRSGAAGLIAIIEMIGGRIIEIDGPLDEAESEDLSVEIEIPLRIGSNRCNVMKTYDRFQHSVQLQSFVISRKALPNKRD